ATDSSGPGIWTTDGTAVGTNLIANVSIVRNGSSVFDSNSTLVSAGNAMFFQAGDGTNGYELWTSDGTTSGTLVLKDIAPGIASSNPKYLTSANGKLFFSATEATHGAQLWVSDGSSTGTTLVRDIFSG